MNIFALKQVCFIILVSCIFKAYKATATEYTNDISRDFRILLMYFSEAFISGATFNGRSLEGDRGTAAARNIVEAIENIVSEDPELPYLEDLIRFKNQLASGITIVDDIFDKASSSEVLKTQALSVQETFIKSIEENEVLIMPVGWIGHALALIIKKGIKEGTFDFAFVNTGYGIKYHYHSADPNGVFPNLSQIWMEFEGVEYNEIVSEDAWFFQGLIALERRDFESKLKELFTRQNETTLPEYFPIYFYGSFLANFKDYLVPPRNEKLFPMQRSGSCTLSSLIGALLYTSRSETVFYFHRLKIGHVLVKSFLSKAKINLSFKNILSDGFDTSGRYFLKLLGSSLAQKTLEYLEYALPNHFKHAGLIGSERFRWIFEKKEAANLALMKAENAVVLENIKISIDLINEVMKFLKDNPISDDSNVIILPDELRYQFEPIQVVLPDIKDLNVICPKNNSLKFLKGKINRLEGSFGSFLKFYDAVEALTTGSPGSPVDTGLILNVFQRGHNLLKDDDWEEIETEGKEKVLSFMKNCKKIAEDIALYRKNLFISFDDIVLLTYLQQLTWKLAVVYDNILPDHLKIGLKSLGAPQTIQSVLFGINRPKNNGKVINILAGNLKEWIIHNCFDQKNVEIFMDLLMQDQEENSKIRFMGPESFCDVDEKSFKPIIPERNRELYLNMMKHPQVGTILHDLMIRINPQNKWINTNPEFGKFIIVFSKANRDLNEIFPHYYFLMTVLALIRTAPIGKLSPGKITKYWTGDECPLVEKDPKSQENNFYIDSQFIEYTKNSYLSIIKSDADKRFYIARHSLALPEEIDITSIETWFNYVKSSPSAKLFDSTYFQYITDHLLNVPKFNGPEMIKFPVEDSLARSIIEELSRLIMISLNTIKTENERISSQKRKLMIIRSVNVSVIVTRFISRIDSMKILSGSECAKSLAHIYNLMIDFANFKTHYFLDENEISRINFALAHICSVSIRNALTFMNYINLGRIQKGLKKTLKRYHWFAAKRSFTLIGIGTSVSDDQFNYGTAESPIKSVETEFLQVLLTTYFLPGLINNDNDSSNLFLEQVNFTYNFWMYLIYMQSLSPRFDVIINISTGAVIFDGLCLVKNNIFINSNEFQNFFSSEDLALASKGITVEIEGTLIYSLADFKGSSYILSKMTGLKQKNDLKIRRKWNDNWYILTTLIEMENILSDLGFEYDWIKNDSLIFKRSFDQKSQEFILFLKDEIDPVMRFTADENSSTIKVVVDGLTEGSVWTILSRNAILSFQRNFERFTRGAYILAKDHQGLFVIICMNLRLPDDRRRPMVLKEIMGAEVEVTPEFKILNTPNTEICINQSLEGNLYLSGTLMITSDSKKAIMLAKAGMKENITTTFYIEKIPIVDNIPAPQTREHKLLLSYYMILNFEFNAARELLHPSASINHNEVFSFEEIKILKWISEIDLKTPEALALKLFTYIHFEINLKKFCYYNDLPRLEIPDAHDYFFAIREMSEKYYIFLVFPEILNETFFTLILIKVYKMPFLSDLYCEMIPINTELLCWRKYEDPNFVSNIKYDVGDKIGYLFFDLIISKNDDQLKLASKLMLRKDHIREYFKDTEMALYCYANEPDWWDEFKLKFNGLKNRKDYKDKLKYLKEIMPIYSKLMNRCIEKFNYYFKGVDQLKNMTMTSIETLLATFKAETNRLRLTSASHNLIVEHLPKLVSKIDIRTILMAEANLRSLLKAENVEIYSVNFDSKTLENSSALSKLKNSIKYFSEENAQWCSRSEIYLGDEFVSILDELESFLASRFKILSSDQKADASELMIMLNSDICSTAIGSLLSLMHQKKAKTFENLYACYFKDSPLVCIQKKFPQLSLEQCIKVKEKAKVFYSRQVLIEYFTKLMETKVHFLEYAYDEPVSADDLNIFCDELSKIKDFNSRMKDPVIMNFEFRSKKYHLKPEQVKDIKLLTTPDQNTKLFLSIVIQRMMAAGKTLVLGTISVVKKASNSKMLSILVPPASLYQSNTTAMQTRTYQYFKKKGINFTFPRFEIESNQNSKSSKILRKYLETVHDLIINVMNENNYLILSPDTLHSYLNSFIEALLNAEFIWNKKYKETLEKYAQIYRIFKDRSSVILDEIDMTMDPKKELNFPTQETEPYNMVAVVLLTDIMEFMIFDDKIIEAGLYIHSNNQASLTESGYKICIDLVLDYIKTQLETDSNIWYKFIFESKSHEATVDNIMSFLTNPNMAGDKEWITAFHNSGNEDIANALIIVKHQLHHQMKHALKGTVNHNFGSAGNLRPEIKFAIPYSAANTPSVASVYADRWETLVKTLLMISASPCSLEIAREFIKYARNAIVSESSNSESLVTTVTCKNLMLILPTNLCPMSLDDENVLHVQSVQQALSARSPAAIRLIFSFYITQVFGKMTFPTEQITSNALNVTSMFNSVQGYSGTIDNVNILPQHVVKEAYEDNLKNEKYNGGISLKLVRDSNDGTVEELSEEAFTKSPEEMVRDLMSLYPSDNVSAIIDTGAFFKNFKNIQVAKAILSVCVKFKAILYYDEDSNLLKYLRITNDTYEYGILETSDPDDIKRITDVEIEERFTFYDQRHITGSDILQPKTAHAIMTVSARVLLRDILQGALRMRQFMTSQKVHLVITKLSRKFYYSKIEEDNESEKNETNERRMKVSEVLTLGALNEDDKQEHENEKLAFGKINSEIRSFILDEISRALVETSSENTKKEFVLKMVKCAKPLFLKSIREIPLNWLIESKDENAANALKLFAIYQLNPIKNVMNDFLSNIELQQRFNSMKKRIKDMISPSNNKYYYAKETILLPIMLDEGSEVQQQTLTLTMVDLNMDQLMENYEASEEYNHDYFLASSLIENEIQNELVSDKTILSFKDLYNENNVNEKLKPYLENTLITLGDRIGVTQDLIKIVKTSLSKKDNNYPIFSEYTFEGTHILVQLYSDNLKVVLISSKHASKFLKDLKYLRDSLSKFWLCDLSGTVTKSNDSMTSVGENVLEFIPQIDNLIFDLLIFNGSLPQILNNSKLRVIYDNWMKSENFEKRAIFLRLRMKALMEKEREIFDVDDGDLVFIKKCSLGIQNSTQNGVEGYPKEVIDNRFELEKIEKFNIIPYNQNTENISHLIKFDLYAEICKIFKICGNSSDIKSVGPEFGPVSTFGLDYLTVRDINIDNDEDFNEIQSARMKIHVSEYPMARKILKEEKIIENGEEVKGEKIKEVLDHEIMVNDEMSEYQEPLLTEFKPIESNEIPIDLSIEFDQIKSDSDDSENDDIETIKLKEISEHEIITNNTTNNNDNEVNNINFFQAPREYIRSLTKRFIPRIINNE